MKFIERIYSIRYEEIDYIDDNNGDRVGLKQDVEVFELNYEDCIDTYVSHSEDGKGYVSYEPVDEAISESIRGLDEVMGYETGQLVRATLENKSMTIISQLNIQIETIKACMEIVFQHSKVCPFDVEERYIEYYKYYLEKRKINN